MKIKWSPLVASASGTTADAVAASWKGIQYIRKHVIPHNPQTAAQTLVRESLARCVTLWRSLSGPFKDWLNTYGVDYRMSGFNVFMSKCRALEQAGDALPIVPANPYVDAPEDIAFVTGVGAAGTIDVSWVDNSPDGYTRMYFAVRRVDGAVFNAVAARDSDELAYTITGLADGEDYDCYAAFRHAVTGMIGTVDGDMAVEAQS